MITAIDTAVLIAIDQGEPDAETWEELLADARGGPWAWLAQARLR